MVTVQGLFFAFCLLVAFSATALVQLYLHIKQASRAVPACYKSHRLILVILIVLVFQTFIAAYFISMRAFPGLVQ